MMTAFKKDHASGVSLTQRLVSGTAWAFAMKALGMLGALAVNALLARMLTPEEVGAYFLILSIVMFAAIIAQFGLRQTVVRLVSESIANNLPGRMRATLHHVFVITTIGACIVGGAIYLVVGEWLASRVFDVEVIATVTGLVAMWVVVLAYQTPIAETFRGLHNIRMATLLDGVLANIVLAFLLGALWSVGSGVSFFHAVSLALFAASASLIFGCMMLIRRTKSIFGEGNIEIREILNISGPLFITNVAHYSVTNASLWIVGAFLTANDVAIYGAAWKLVNLVILPLLIVNLAVQPIISELHAKGHKNQLQNALRGTATLAGLPALIVLLIFLFFGSDVLGLIYGDYYRQAATILVLLSLGQLSNVWAGSSREVLALTGYHKQLMMLILIAGAFCLLLAVFAVKLWGVMGVAYITAFGFILQNGIAWLLVRKKLGLWTHATLSPGFILLAMHKVIQR